MTGSEDSPGTVKLPDPCPSPTLRSSLLKPNNRPLCHPDGLDGLPKMVKLVVARILPVQRMWRKLDEGGGIICESSDGTLRAREKNGLCGARLELDVTKKGDIRGVTWEEGVATDVCSRCCYGPGAMATAMGREPREDSRERSGSWLPKLVNVKGEMTKIPDEFRAPKCTPGIDVLAYVLVPEFQGAPAEVMPALISFAKTSGAAGKQLASMIKLSLREPAWAKIYELGSQSTTNERGTFFISTIRGHGYAPPAMAAMAEQLYEDSKSKSYGTHWDEDEDNTATKPAATDAAANPEDKF